jgi:GTP cyclohydrolase I
MVRIYLGFNRMDGFKFLCDVGAKNVLFSFADVREGNIRDKDLTDIKNSGVSVIVDSGAVNFANKGIDDYPTSYLDAYADFIKENSKWVDAFVIPDVIGNYEKTLKYAKYLLNSGVDIEKLIFVVHSPHTGGDFRNAFKAIDMGFKYIGFGGWGKMSGIGYDSKVKYLDETYWDVVNSGVRVHFFGITDEDLIFRYMPFSCDSVTWTKGPGLNAQVNMSDGSIIHLFRNDRGGVLDSINFDVLEKIVGYGFDKFLGDYRLLLYALNVKYYLNLEKIINTPDLRETYLKMKSMSSFNQSFYRCLYNYLYALTGDREVANTPRRWVNALNEYLSGYRYNVYDVVGKEFSAPSDNEIIRIKIPFSSMCIHHLLPFYGHVFIEYRPSDRILGLSKFSRVVNVLSRRLQIQERLTKEIYDVLNNVLRPRELKVKVRAKHLCCRDRGVRIGSVFETEVSSSGSGDDREGKA